MRRITLQATLWLLTFAAFTPAFAQGLVDGYTADVPLTDTARAVSLPRFPREAAGAHGFVKTTSDGRFVFDDGSPARFVGVTLEWSACMPDSAQAITMAARMAKLGINLVRMRYFENAYWWAEDRTILDAASGFQALNEQRMRRFDWLVYQLQMRGIYVYLTLQSSRAPVAADGYGTLVDSALWLGLGMYHTYPQGRTVLKHHARLILDHTNPFTGRAYKNEPAIAMMELMGYGGITFLYKLGYTQHIPGAGLFSYAQSRRLDTMYASYLRDRYSGQAGLNVAWQVTPPAGGFPNLLQEGSFEGQFDRHWTALAYGGTTVNTILIEDDSVPDGRYSMTLRVRGSRGILQEAYMVQTVPIEYNTLYRLSFRAKSSNPEGRTVYLAGTESVEGTYAGLSANVAITSSWKEHELFFTSQAIQKAPVAVYMFFGDIDGDVSVDDFELKAVQPIGLRPGERLDDATVERIPYAHASTLTFSSKRIEDQAEFFMKLDRDLFTELRRYIHDTVRARQPISGAGHVWATNMMEGSVERTMDFTTANAQWDYVEAFVDSTRIRNTSQLRAGYAAVIYDNSAIAHDKQPFVAAFMQPHPNRFLAESMLLIPAYAMHQQWDAVIFDIWTDDRAFDTIAGMTTGKFSDLAKNPVANALMPVVAQMFRRELLKPALTTIRLQHTRQQIQQLPRFGWSLGRHAVPISIPLWAMAVNRVVQDSLDASEFSQSNDISFPPTLDDELTSDTREIRWEFVQGVLSINTPRLQAATGHLSRSGGVSLDHLDIELLSDNQTATVAWVTVDSARSLEDIGRSFLVVTSRTEPTGMAWKDTNVITGWGRAPMLVEPIRARLTFAVDSPLTRLVVTPLDSSGRWSGSPLSVASDGSVVIDQRQTQTQWYEVVVDPRSDVTTGNATIGSSIRALRTSDPSRITLEIRLARPAGDARLDLFDAVGRHCATIPAGDLSAGTSRHTLDMRGLASGSYTAVLRTSGAQVSTRIAVVR